jgi:hypothetical protein
MNQERKIESLKGQPRSRRSVSRAATEHPLIQIQHTAGNRAASSVVQRMCGIDNSLITIEDSAKKHKAQFAGGVTRVPSDDDVRRNFHSSMKFGKKELRPDDRDPSSMKFEGGSNRLVFKEGAGKYRIYHFHSQSYSGDRE